MYKYQMKVYNENNELWNIEKSNNINYYDKFKNKENYKIKIYERINNKWILIYSEK